VAAIEPPADTTEGLAAAAAAVGDRWTLQIVGALLDAGPLRFGELRARVAGIAPNVLAARLRHLEAEGLVSADAYSRRPPRFAYELTVAGRELGAALFLLARWGAERAGADPPRHAACCTPLEARVWCPACGVPVDGDEPDELHVV
jgi:DNA-binding HxlR family transcriptional regulator